MRAAGLTLALLLLGTAPAQATAVHVPADYASISLAIAAAPETIYVADGIYPDSIAIDASLVLLPEPGATITDLPAYPTIGPVTFTSMNPRVLVIRGFHIAGYFLQMNTFNCGGSTTLEGCRIDAGVILTLTGCSITHFNLRGCIVRGGVFAYSYYQAIDGCTFLDGGVHVWSHGRASLRSNLLVGPAGFGIKTQGDALITIEDNQVTGTTEGIVGSNSGVIRRNTIEDVTGTAIRNVGANFNVSGNVIRRSGGHGIDLSATGPAGLCRGNVIDSVGGRGIQILGPGVGVGSVDSNVVQRCGSDGIYLGVGSVTTVRGNLIDGAASACLRISGTASNVQQNVVRRAAAEGMNLGFVGTLVGNVAGRNGADGFHVSHAVRARSNTSYLNGGAGFGLGGVGTDSIAHNIAYGNSGYGAAWSGTGEPSRACNDFFANTAGPISGLSPAVVDLNVNPQFCNVGLDDVTLSSASPLAAYPGCGLIGALGVGCVGSTLQVPPAAGISHLRLSAMPVPARNGVHFSWPPQEGRVRLDVFDVAGSRRWSGTVDGSRGAWDWNGRQQDGRAIPAGMYVARIAAGQQVADTRVVIAR